MSLIKEAAVAPAQESGWFYTADRTPVLRYELEQAGQVLHVEWQYGPGIDDVKQGFLELARLLRENRTPVLLSDSNHYEGDWSELIPWVRYEVLPTAIDHGLRYLVDVLPSDPASSLAIFSWREETRDVLQHEVFHSLDAARQWIREQLLSRDGQ